jgi:hypothetical protein
MGTKVSTANPFLPCHGPACHTNDLATTQLIMWCGKMGYHTKDHRVAKPCHAAGHGVTAHLAMSPCVHFGNPQGRTSCVTSFSYLVLLFSKLNSMFRHFFVE